MLCTLPLILLRSRPDASAVYGLDLPFFSRNSALVMGVLLSGLRREYFKNKGVSQALVYYLPVSEGAGCKSTRIWIFVNPALVMYLVAG